jgi:serine/threonine protein kinase
MDFCVNFRILPSSAFFTFMEAYMTTDEAGPLEPASSAAAPSTGIHTDPVGEFKCAACGGTIGVTGLMPFSDVACPGCGAHASVPARLGNFLLLRLMGTGGMGGVYYARDEVLGRFVAIKVMLQSLGDDPAFIETFQREAQAVAKLNHPNIAQIYSFGREKGQPYIVMELVSGERVDAMMESPQGLSPALAIRIGLEIAQGLNAADEAGLVHGDIKPENILLDNKGQAKLVDFGLATVAHQAAGEGIWGTPYYIAPEKIRRQKVDARSDIYSLGATLFHMLTGKPPFEGETPVEVVKARLDNPPPDPCVLKPELPEIVSTTIKRMLAVDRAERYPNYLSLISDLRKAAQDIGSSAPVITMGGGSGGKKIRFNRKKGGAMPAQTPAPETPDAFNTGAKGKKLVIHKDSQSVSTARTASPPLADAAGHGTKPAKPVTPPPTPEEIEARKKRIRRRQRITMIILFILLLLLAAGTTGTFLKLHHDAEILRRVELVALNNARTEASTLFLAISKNTEQIAFFAQRTAPLETNVQSSVERITGSKMTIEPPPPPPAEEPPASTNAAAIPETPAAADAKATPEATVPAEATAAEPTVEAQPDPAAEATGAAGTGEGTPPPAEPEVPAHPVVAPARLALENIMALSQLDGKAKFILEAAKTIQDRVLKSNSSAQGATDVKELQGLNENTEAMAVQGKTAFEVVIAKAAQVQEIRIRFERQIEATQAAEREAVRRREEAERAERERQEYQTRAVAEIQQAQNDRAEVKAMFDAHNFEGALATLKQRLGNYTTKEGKDAFQVCIDRYTFLTQMKEGLITAMQEMPYTWGWGSGNSARDIEKADGKGIYVKGTRKPYAWAEIPSTQMLKLVDYYIEMRTTKPRARINIAFGAAIYCDEFGPTARDRARNYANRAMDMGLTKESFTRLLESGWQ